MLLWSSGRWPRAVDVQGCRRDGRYPGAAGRRQQEEEGGTELSTCFSAECPSPLEQPVGPSQII